MPVIAVDGPAASGKGTIARALAACFDLPHLDTGILYRGVGWLALQKGLFKAGEPISDGGETALAAPAVLADLVAGLSPVLLADPALRTAEAAEAASRVAAIPAVRQALLAFQRAFAGQPGGAVLDGRDIGTVIVPDADAKLFVTARPEVRAGRRHAELAKTGVTFGEVLADIRRRDARDEGRTEAPLRPAADALLLDNSDFDTEASVACAIAMVQRRLSQVF